MDEIDPITTGFQGHQLTFRLPTDSAACLRCRRLLTLEDIGSRCPGPPERVPSTTEPGNPA